MRQISVIGIVLVVLALIGLADSAYLTFEHYRDAPPVCIISDSPILGVFDNCGKVTTSKYAEIFNIPLAVLGVAYSAAALVLALFLTRRRAVVPLVLLAVVTSLGFIASVWFVYLQIAVIGALCLYCIISAGATTGLAALSWGMYLRLDRLDVRAAEALADPSV